LIEARIRAKKMSFLYGLRYGRMKFIDKLGESKECDKSILWIGLIDAKEKQQPLV
jgi:hypothetical protein